MKSEQLAPLLATQFNMSQHVIHKPKKAGGGAAMKIQLRLEPVWDKDGGFFTKESLKQGGLFLDLAAQNEGTDAGGNPTFNWETGALITAKLGIPDMTAILVGIREFRKNRADIPVYLRPKSGEANVVNLFHKNPKGGSTIITLTFEDEKSILRISKGPQQFRSIALSMSEELILESYLALALDAFLRVGKR